MLLKVLAAGPALGGEPFALNDVPGAVRYPRVDGRPSVGVVATWAVAGDPSATIMARRFDASLTPLGPGFAVSTGTVDRVTNDVGMGGAGQFVVVWEDGFYGPGALDVMARRFDAAGTALGDAFQVNEYTTNSQFVPVVAVAESGTFVVAWHSYQNTSSDVFARRYDATGNPLGGEFQVNTYTTGRQREPAIAIDPMGGHVVVWLAEEGTGGRAIYGQRYDAAGVPAGGEFQVSAAVTTYLRAPALAVADDGSFVVSWNAPDGVSSFGALARAFDAGGNAFAPEFPIRADPVSYALAPAVASDGQRFLLAHSDVLFTTAVGVARFHEPATGALGPEFQLSSIRGQYVTDAGRGPAGDVLVVWEPTGGITPDLHVYGRRIRLGSVRGTRCTVASSTGGSRRIRCTGSERLSPNFIDDDATTGGAVLRIVATGATPSDQSFALAAPQWAPIGPGPLGFRYANGAGADGPVRSVVVKRAPGGKFVLKATIAGTASSPSPGLAVVPPNPGDSVVIALTLAGGRTYCAGLGTGQGGGQVIANDVQRFSLREATDDVACP